MAQGLSGTSLAIDFETVRGLSVDVWRTLEQWITDGNDRAPILMIGLAVTAATPLLALLGYLANRLLAKSSASKMRFPQDRVIGTNDWPREAWLTFDGLAGGRCLLDRDLHSIGREDDNDVQLADASVHRHHAVVHHTDDRHFVIRDLSGRGGNGVRVNGQRIAEAALSAGDVIEVGKVVLRFNARAT